jgi:hypothetical protein
MGSQKTLTNEKYMYNCKEFQIYKTKKGVRLIKINNSFVNINNVPSINSKINDKNRNDMVSENINELNNLDICDIRDSRDSHKIIDSAETSDNSDVDYSLDGEEYIIIDRSIQ